MKSPCKDCAERIMGCHCSCSKYKLFDAFNNARRLREYKARQCKRATEEILERERRKELRKKGVRV